MDIGGGAAKEFAPELLRKIGCNVQVLNGELAGSSRGPDPTADELLDLSVASKDKEIGFAFDLDGDRLVVVRNGKKQVPDVTLGLGVAKSLELGYKNFVLSIDTSISIEKFIKEQGGTVKRSKVGEANVIDLMLKSNAQAGGEGSSGGFILPEFNYCREGILTSGLIASMMRDSKFHEILEYMESYHQIREKTAVDAKFHDKVIDNVKSKFSKEYSEINDMDGVKCTIDEDSWVLIRKSNTEDIIRVSAESNNSEKCKKIVKDTLKLVNETAMTKLDEKEIIQIFQKNLNNKKFLSEDVEVFNLDKSKIIVKTDTLVESTDIPNTMNLRDAARKSVMACVSDFAAKGVRPQYGTISVNLPKKITRSQINQISKGFGEASKEYGIFISGGDTNEGKETVFNVCVFGKDKNITSRKGAKIGDYYL